MKSYLFTKSKPAGERKGVTYTRMTPARLIALVDELYMGIVPVLLGSGVPLFPSGFPQRGFKLLENKTYSQGLVAMRYQRSRAG